MANELDKLESVSLPERAPGVVEEEVEEGLLLLREDGRYLVINHTAALVWRNLSSTGSVAEMVRKVSGLKGAPGPEESLSVVASFIGELKREGFVRDSL